MGRQSDREVGSCGWWKVVFLSRSVLTEGADTDALWVSPESLPEDSGEGGRVGHQRTQQETRCVLLARMEGPQSPLLSLCLQRWVFSLERLSCLPELRKPGEGGLRVPGPGASRLRHCASSSLFLTLELTSWRVDPESSA